MISLSLFLSLVAAGLIGGFVTPALTGRAELRSQRFGNYPLTQQPTTAQIHSHTLSPSFSLSLTHRHTHIHTWPACQYVRDGETGCLCFPSRSLSPPSHLSPSLISWVRFRGEEGVKLRRLLTFHSNIQSILSHPGPELTHPCTCTHPHTQTHTHEWIVILGDQKGSSSSTLSSIGPIHRLTDSLSSLANVQQLVKHRK